MRENEYSRYIQDFVGHYQKHIEDMIQSIGKTQQALNVLEEEPIKEERKSDLSSSLLEIKGIFR